MPTITSQLRSGLHARLGITTESTRDPAQMSAEIHRMQDALHRIVAIAEPRLIMGGIRYGSEWTHEALMKYMQLKFDNYKQTGNFEMLIDFLNFIPIESVLKTHPNHHFNAKDRG
jgi:hypothetical protein